MDITSFLMGICAVTVVSLIAVVVVGMFRINRLSKSIDSTNKNLDYVSGKIREDGENIRRLIDSRVDSLRSTLEKEDLNLHQRIDNMFTYIDGQDRSLHERIDELGRQITNNK
jgi:NifB/MoaA-like Fe-S oxidoreductase